MTMWLDDYKCILFKAVQFTRMVGYHLTAVHGAIVPFVNFHMKKRFTLYQRDLNSFIGLVFQVSFRTGSEFFHRVSFSG